MDDSSARLQVHDSLNLGAMKQKTLAAIAIFEGFILLGFLANSLGWFNSLHDFSLLGGCGGEIYATAQSPDKTLTAYVFERSCGATTGFSTIVVIRPSSEKLDLTKDLVTDEIVFFADGDYHPQLKWLTQNDLQVEFKPNQAPGSQEIWEQSVKHDGLNIEYKGLN